jgi:hypothetical protein
MAADLLVCPTCAREHPASERFCAGCGMPLVYAAGVQDDGERPPGGEGAGAERLERARKIKPQYTEGELVKAVRAGSQTEAEFIQGLLLEEGVPSLARRSRGFDVPDFMAAGPRDVMVPESGLNAAREVLLQSELLSLEASPESIAGGAWRVMAWLLVGLAVVALIVWLHP